MRLIGFSLDICFFITPFFTLSVAQSLLLALFACKKDKEHHAVAHLKGRKRPKVFLQLHLSTSSRRQPVHSTPRLLLLHDMGDSGAVESWSVF